MNKERKKMIEIVINNFDFEDVQKYIEKIGIEKWDYETLPSIYELKGYARDMLEDCIERDNIYQARRSFFVLWNKKKKHLALFFGVSFYYHHAERELYV